MATTHAKRKPVDRAEPPPLPGKELLVKMLETMVLARAIEDRMASMYRSGDLRGSLYSGHTFVTAVESCVDVAQHICATEGRN